MLRALAERDITPDLLVGTSGGALNAVFLWTRGTGLESLDELDAIRRGLPRDDVFPLRAQQMVLALAGARDALCAGSGLERLVRRHVPFDRQQAALPVHLVATDLLSGEEVLLSDGDVVGAVLASSAIPAVLPPVPRGSRTLVDGGPADNAAISRATALGADRVVVLPTGNACALPAPPTRPSRSPSIAEFGGGLPARRRAVPSGARRRGPVAGQRRGPSAQAGARPRHAAPRGRQTASPRDPLSRR